MTINSGKTPVKPSQVSVATSLTGTERLLGTRVQGPNSPKTIGMEIQQIAQLVSVNTTLIAQLVSIDPSVIAQYVVLDYNQVSVDYNQIMLDYNQFVLDYSQISVDYSQISVNPALVSVDPSAVAQYVSIDYNQVSVDYSQIVLDYDQVSIDYSQVSVDYAQIPVDYSQVSVNTSAVAALVSVDPSAVAQYVVLDYNQISVDYSQVSIDYNQVSVNTSAVAALVSVDPSAVAQYVVLDYDQVSINYNLVSIDYSQVSVNTTAVAALVSVNPALVSVDPSAVAQFVSLDYSQVSVNLSALASIIDFDSSVTPGVYGTSTVIPQLTINAEGRITSVALVTAVGGGPGAADVIHTINASAGSVVATSANTSMNIYGDGVNITTSITGQTLTVKHLPVSSGNNGFYPSGVGNGPYVDFPIFNTDENGHVTSIDTTSRGFFTYLNLYSGGALVTAVEYINNKTGIAFRYNTPLSIAARVTGENFNPSMDILHKRSTVVSGVYGTSTIIPRFEVNEYGHVLSVSNVTLPAFLTSETPRLLWATVSASQGSTTANVSADNLAVRGAGGISTSITGDVLTVQHDTLVSVGGVTSTYGTSTIIPRITLNQYGHIISIVPVTIPAASFTETPRLIWATISASQGSTTADVSADNLAVRGANGISTSITGDVLTVYNTSSGASAGQYNNNIWNISFDVDGFGRITSIQRTSAARTSLWSDTGSFESFGRGFGIFGGAQMKVSAATTAAAGGPRYDFIVEHSVVLSVGGATSIYGSTSTIPRITVNQYGHIVSITQVAAPSGGPGGGNFVSVDANPVFIGQDASAAGTDSIAIGRNARALGADSIVIGTSITDDFISKSVKIGTTHDSRMFLNGISQNFNPFLNSTSVRCTSGASGYWFIYSTSVDTVVDLPDGVEFGHKVYISHGTTSVTTSPSDRIITVRRPLGETTAFIVPPQGQRVSTFSLTEGQFVGLVKLDGDSWRVESQSGLYDSGPFPNEYSLRAKISVSATTQILIRGVMDPRFDSYEIILNGIATNNATGRRLIMNFGVDGVIASVAGHQSQCYVDVTLRGAPTATADFLEITTSLISTSAYYSGNINVFTPHNNRRFTLRGTGVIDKNAVSVAMTEFCGICGTTSVINPTDMIFRFQGGTAFRDTGRIHIYGRINGQRR